MTNYDITKPTANKVFKKVWVSNLFNLSRYYTSFQQWIGTSSLIPNFLKYVFVRCKFNKTTYIRRILIGIMLKITNMNNITDTILNNNLTDLFNNVIIPSLHQMYPDIYATVYDKSTILKVVVDIYPTKSERVSISIENYNQQIMIYFNDSNIKEFFRLSRTMDEITKALQPNLYRIQPYFITAISRNTNNI